MLPTLVVISNGNTTKYKHPRLVTLSNLAALNPAPTILQTNKYLRDTVIGGNVADEFIADLVLAGQDGDILLTVDANGSYVASYRGTSLPAFQAKPRAGAASPAVSILSLLPNPAGEDRDLEEVELRNNTGTAIPVTGWFLRDASGRVWTLASLVQLPAGGASTIRRNGMAMSLDNSGDTIELLNEVGGVVHRVTYGATAESVRVSP